MGKAEPEDEQPRLAQPARAPMEFASIRTVPSSQRTEDVLTDLRSDR